MALTYIKNALVEKAFSGGKGFAVSETFKKNDGTEGKTRWKLWFDEPQSLAEGARIDASGLHSDKVVEFEGKDGLVRTVERSLNGARITSQSEADPAPAAGGEVW